MFTEKIDTFKSGHFVLSRRYSLRSIQPLAIESRILSDTIKDLPILPALGAQLDQEVIKKSIFGTAAIEGNPLSEEKVAELIDDSDQDSLMENHEIEIRNLKKAYDLVKSVGQFDEPFVIDEELIKSVHRIITTGTDDQMNNPGHYRNHKVQVGNKSHGGIYTPPKCLPDIENLMGKYVNWLNSTEIKKLFPPIRAALAHYHLALIHPFGNGNGRTARLVEALIMQSSGFKYTPLMLSNYYYQHIDDYFWAFSKTEKSKNDEVTHFVSFVLIGFIKALKELKNRIVYYIRKFSLRDYYLYLRTEKKITLRQFDLLNLLLENSRPFTMKELYDSMDLILLYRNVSTRTARRDLQKLEKMKLLTIDNSKNYELNMNALG